MAITGMTGEKVDVAGVYQNQYGRRISLPSGSSFPPCPKEGKSITWEKVDK